MKSENGTEVLTGALDHDVELCMGMPKAVSRLTLLQGSGGGEPPSPQTASVVAVWLTIVAKQREDGMNGVSV